MMMSERIQALIHKLEVDVGARWLNYLSLTLAVLALAVWYDTHCYRNFNSPEAMDAAQVGRNLAEGHGFTTEFVRPFSLYLLQQHNAGLLAAAAGAAGTNVADTAEVYGRHPDLANAPLYPLALAGLFKLTKPDVAIDQRHSFWSESGRFSRYKPEFIIAIFNQLLLLAVVLMTFLVTKMILDTAAAWLAAILMFCSDVLWKFSVSGLPTLLLLVIFLGLVWCLAAFETAGQVENPDPRRRVWLAAGAGFFAGLGMLTHYSFGWVIVPVFIFLLLFGGARRAVLAMACFLVFAGVVSPWIARNLAVSGTMFGTAGYAVLEGTGDFQGSRLMQSVSPVMGSAHWVMGYLIKLQANIRYLLPDEVPRVGGSWVGILFLAGLLLGLRNTVARRLRYFALMCLGVFLVVTAMERTQLSALSELSTENELVLLTPLAVIFGVAFFLTMLNQMNLPSVPLRYVVICLAILLLRTQFALTLLPPRTSPIVFPPYYPPEIQKTSAWMQPNELMMSDIPWAVAWYGDRQCVWTTINCNYEFYQLNDYVKPVRALYLSFYILDAKLWSECLHGGTDSWGNFALRFAATGQTQHFPLNVAPYGATSGLFLTDRQRWQSE